MLSVSQPSLAPSTSTGHPECKASSEHTIPEDNETFGAWTEVRRKRTRASLPAATTVLRGTAAPGTTALSAAERVKFLHLYYVRQGTTAEQVRAHLTTVCGDDVCTVETLKARGNYASFKLGVPYKQVDRVLEVSNWAEDICVKPWRQSFRRPQEQRKSEAV